MSTAPSLDRPSGPAGPDGSAPLLPHDQRRWWALAGLAVGLAGLGASYLAARLLAVDADPITAVADGVIRLTPGGVVEWAIQAFGHRDKLVLLLGILIVVGAVFAGLGVLARRAVALPLAGYIVLAAVGGLAILGRTGAGALDQLPVVVGFLVWSVGLGWAVEPLRRGELAGLHDPAVARGEAGMTRRGVLFRAAVLGAAAVVGGAVGRLAGRGRAAVEEARAGIRIPGVTSPPVPAGAHPDVPGLPSWQTSAADFYQIHTVFVPPAIAPQDWSLRIHGLVERELTLTYDDLLAREITQDWITLNCVSNPVGGDLVGNAWWSGVRLAPILAELGISPDADAVLQTSSDGWTCGTPLAALTDDRNAMLALAMNGEPLTIDHGFPVRTLVPGLYGYVSGTKWVVDLEVTRFDRIEAYWTRRGWGELGPVKIASRIDVPASGDSVPAGEVVVAGAAWMQHTGIRGVEVSLDGGTWQPAELGSVPGVDSWVQWSARVQAAPGDHTVRARAIDADGRVQTAVVRDVLPDGATGLDERDFTAT
ncbi:molybdopterin-dependent oxidoreductase [Nocardioides sp. TRM66260-LWL]|uniref:molybdopterin-dependent oxidoreductase n=1 Tax=Nocardioides sp. TRM66260-LWL TaxID=2874478 RepID=UPI001CC50123|nr:molybdopterin-dependent oxidoreductase [Nocardioides sp. TRM66260-LWL]MBZ5734619.1 molybdopterin-dependent oxidoreductase [Nocardioides sp. TRM66260-LWL]